YLRIVTPGFGSPSPASDLRRRRFTRQPRVVRSGGLPWVGRNEKMSTLKGNAVKDFWRRTHSGNPRNCLLFQRILISPHPRPCAGSLERFVKLPKPPIFVQ